MIRILLFVVALVISLPVLANEYMSCPLQITCKNNVYTPMPEHFQPISRQPHVPDGVYTFYQALGGSTNICYYTTDPIHKEPWIEIETHYYLPDTDDPRSKWVKAPQGGLWCVSNNPEDCPFYNHTLTTIIGRK